MIVFAGVLAASLVVATEQDGHCALALRNKLPCVTTSRGAVIGAEPGEASALKQALTAAEDRFTIRFNRAPPSYALLVGRTPDVVTKELTAAEVVLLPWISEKTQLRAMRIDILTSVLKDPKLGRQLRGLGFTEQDSAGLVDEFWDDLNIAISTYPPYSTLAAHELAHLWFDAAFPSPVPEKPTHRYGTAWPDWLDEAAALSVEGDAGATPRRAEFRDAWRSGGPAPDPLALLLTRIHPVMAQQKDAADVQTSSIALPDGGKVVTSTFMGPTDTSDIFYPQVVAFSDFLQAETANPGVLGEIAAAVAGGTGMEQWLAQSDSGRRLGGSLQEMEVKWRAWLTREYGQPGAPSYKIVPQADD
jgi:hypothetical protein